MSVINQIDCFYKQIDYIYNKKHKKTNNGKELPSGVYNYKLAFSNGLTEKTGHLTLKH